MLIYFQGGFYMLRFKTKFFIVLFIFILLVSFIHTYVNASNEIMPISNTDLDIPVRRN